jgi:hypothetical protein
MADDAGEWHGLTIQLKSGGEISLHEFRRQAAHIHMRRTGCRAGGRIFLDAAIFLFA